MTVPCAGIVRLVGRYLLLAALAAVTSSVEAAAPNADERRQIEMLIGSYYQAVAQENLDEVVDLHHWENSFERDKIEALARQAFGVADSRFDRVRVRSIDLYPERNIGLARVEVDYRLTSYDGQDTLSGTLEAAIVLVRGTRGWRIGKTGRAADFDLTAAAAQFADKSLELEETVAPADDPETPVPSSKSKLPKLAAATAPVAVGASHQSTPSASATGSAPANGGLTFFALRRRATGACEVVAGAQGISPGDTVFGAFPDFGAAQRAVAAGCGGGENAVQEDSRRAAGAGPLTTERLFEPDDTVTRGAWGTVTRIAGSDGFAQATDGGRPVEDGFFVHPGSGGPTEIVYRHDGSPATLQGRATIIDCLGHCGRGGSTTFFIRGDGKELWNSGLVRHEGQGQTFAASLEGVSEVRLVSTDGGNGTGEDWAAWLDLRIAESQDPATPVRATQASGSEVDGPVIVAVPRYRADESTAGAWVINLLDGTAEFIDRVGIDGNSSRRRPMNLNVFTVLGRLNDKPAKPGEILAGEIRSNSGAVTGLFLVDTSTGAAAYLADLEKEPHRGTYRQVNGRPAAAIASDDGNFALVMRRDSAGGTDGAYLYHATSGQCVYFANVDEMRPDPVVKFTSPLPKMNGRVVAVPLQNGSEATPECLLIEEKTGALFKVSGLERDPTRFTVARQNLGLFEFFPSSPPWSAAPRFVVVPGYSDNGAADAVFIVDAGSGRMAVLKDVRRGGAMRLVGSTKSLEGYLSVGEEDPMPLAAVPKVGGSGTTDGAWVFDAAGDEVLLLENIRGPHNLRIRRVAGR